MALSSQLINKLMGGVADMPIAWLATHTEQAFYLMRGAKRTGWKPLGAGGRRTDMYLSTLRSHIKAMGGDLEIIAKFPDGAVRISNFATEQEEVLEEAFA